MVAWHEVPGKPVQSVPVLEGRDDPISNRTDNRSDAGTSFGGTVNLRETSTDGADRAVPYGTDRLFFEFQALRAWLPSFCPSGTISKPSSRYRF